jgi:hypothetical protein
LLLLVLGIGKKSSNEDEHEDEEEARNGVSPPFVKISFEKHFTAVGPLYVSLHITSLAL